MFAVRFLTKKEFEILDKKYQEAMNSGERRKQISELANEVESDLVLLGMTAVEDSLQKRVKEAITRLLEADIKVWMITGDKLETAENIGLMAGIVTSRMRVFHLRNVSKKKFLQKVQKLHQKVNTVRSGVQKGVVFDMRSVGNFKISSKIFKIFKIFSNKKSRFHFHKPRGI